MNANVNDAVANANADADRRVLSSLVFLVRVRVYSFFNA